MRLDRFRLSILTQSVRLQEYKMGAGDVTILGPYDVSDTSTAETAIAGARVSANDKWLTYNCSNGLQFYVIHIEES